MKKSVLFIIAIITIFVGSYIGVEIASQPIFIDNQQEKIPLDSSKPRILVSCLTHGMGGGEMHTLTLIKMLRNHNYHVVPLVNSDSKLSTCLKELHIQHYTSSAHKFHGIFRPLFHIILKKCYRSLCEKEHIDIIHCNTRPEIVDAVNAKKYCPVKVLFTHHIHYPLFAKQIRGLDAIVTVNVLLLDHFKHENLHHDLGIKNIDFAAPFFDIERIYQCKTTETKEVFFKANFGITINQHPIIIVPANMHKLLSIKNHPLLFEAIKILVHEKKKTVNVMLVGDGESKQYLMNLAKDLHIDTVVNFLGFCNNMPELMKHSDIMVLPSKQEGFGIVYLEAGLMRKSSIGATRTGAEAVIINEKTGLLFQNNDAQDLVHQIERLLDNPAWAQELGNNAYDHVMKNFTPEVTFKKYEALYQDLHESKALA